MTVELQAEQIAPQVTWGTNPGMVIGVTDRVPDPGHLRIRTTGRRQKRALQYMGLKAGTPIVDIARGPRIHRLLHDPDWTIFRAAAHLIAGKHVAKNIKQALIVPGSRGIKAAAEKKASTRFSPKLDLNGATQAAAWCIGMNAGCFNRRTSAVPALRIAISRDARPRQPHPSGQSSDGSGSTNCRTLRRCAGIRCRTCRIGSS